jgi:hypothetical protein
MQACLEGKSGWPTHFPVQSAYAVAQPATHWTHAAQSGAWGAGGVGAGVGAGAGAWPSAAAVRTGGETIATDTTTAVAKMANR